MKGKLLLMVFAVQTSIIFVCDGPIFRFSKALKKVFTRNLKIAPKIKRFLANLFYLRCTLSLTYGQKMLTYGPFILNVEKKNARSYIPIFSEIESRIYFHVLQRILKIQTFTDGDDMI